MSNQDKVPSIISYFNENNSNGGQPWGNNIPPKAVAMMHTKLQLATQSVSDELDLIIRALDGMKNFDIEHVKDSKAMPQYTDKSAEEIVTDYLTLVFKHLNDQVKAFGDAFREMIPVDIVITIPTVNFPRP
jgi:hypothetical protein